MKKSFLIGLAGSLLLSLYGCIGAKKSQSSIIDKIRDSISLNSKQWAKDYGFCMCLYYGKQKDTVIGHDISFSILKEISGYNLNEYAKIDSLAKKFALAIKPSEIADYEGQKPVLLNCLEFQKSKQLDSLISILKN